MIEEGNRILEGETSKIEDFVNESKRLKALAREDMRSLEKLRQE